MNEIALKFMKKSDLAREFGISLKTLNKHINQHFEVRSLLDSVKYDYLSHYFTPRQSQIIFFYFGYPDRYSFISDRLIEYIPIRSYTRKELQNFYGIDFKTLWSFIQRIPRLSRRGNIIDIDKNMVFSAEQISHIFWYLGHPFYRSTYPLEQIPETEMLDYEEIRLEWEYKKQEQRQRQFNRQIQWQMYQRVNQIADEVFARIRKDF